MKSKITFYLIFISLLFLMNVECVYSQHNPFTPRMPKETSKSTERNILNQVQQNQVNPDTNPTQSDRFSDSRTQPNSSSVNPPELTVTGLIWDSQRPQAIVNGRVVDVRSTFKLADDQPEIKIISINNVGVEIAFNGRNLILSPYKE